jgi:hypothetical protein
MRGLAGALWPVAEDPGECCVADQVERRLPVRRDAEGGEVLGQLGPGEWAVRCKNAPDEMVGALA